MCNKSRVIRQHLSVDSASPNTHRVVVAIEFLARVRLTKEMRLAHESKRLTSVDST